MKLTFSRPQRPHTIYVQESFRDKNGKSTSKKIERLGSEEDIERKHGCPDGLEWAKEYVARLNEEARLGRKKVDFGQGFYLTKLKSQAESWAKTVAARKGRTSKPILSAYDFDYDIVTSEEYRVKVFESYNLEWLDYVVDCRRGGMKQQQYDIVEGGVANDNVIDTVEDYENGIITAEQALGQLRYKEVNHQICILNQEIVDKHLKYIESETLNLED